MPNKEVHLFDVQNRPLQVAGIHLELFDAITCALIDVKISGNMSPGHGPGTIAWGAILSFPATTNPLDLYLSDPNFRYPGNSVRYLNGRTTDRIDIDLLAVPTSPSGSPPPPPTSTAVTVSHWVQGAPNWSPEEKRAVRNLILNYVAAVVVRRDEFPILPTRLNDLAANWEDALYRLGIDPHLLTR